MVSFYIKWQRGDFGMELEPNSKIVVHLHSFKIKILILNEFNLKQTRWQDLLKKLQFLRVMMLKDL